MLQQVVVVVVVVVVAAVAIAVVTHIRLHLECIQADAPPIIDIRMVDRSLETYFRRLERVPIAPSNDQAFNPYDPISSVGTGVLQRGWGQRRRRRRDRVSSIMVLHKKALGDKRIEKGLYEGKQRLPIGLYNPRYHPLVN